MDTESFVKAADGIDRFTGAIGRAAAWCALFIVLAGFAVVLLRYVLDIGSIWLSESILYAHAGLFLLAAAGTLAADGHVRVDVFYAHASPRRRAWVNLVGAIVLLLPFACMLVVLALPYVARAWEIMERSREASGLPFVYLLKTLIPLFGGLLALQAFSQIFRSLAVLLDGERDVSPASPLPAKRREGTKRGASGGT